MSYRPLPKPESLDEAYAQMFAAIRGFYRYERRHPNDALPAVFDDAYFQKVTDNLKTLVDHENKYLRSPYLE